MMRRAGVVIVAVAVATIWAASFSMAGGTGSNRSIDEAVRFRVTFGLRADRNFVEMTFADAAFTVDDWGVPLSNSEASDLFARVERIARFTTSIESPRFTSLPDYAGTYFDQRRGGMAVVQVSSNVGAAGTAVAAELGPDDWWEVVRVDRSLDDLDAARRRVYERQDEMAAAGTTLTNLRRLRYPPQPAPGWGYCLSGVGTGVAVGPWTGSGCPP